MAPRRDDEDSIAPTHGLPEALSAAAMLLPSAVSLWYLSRPCATAATTRLALGCCLHCPFSSALHLHRAFWTSQAFRTKILYRLDMTFIHVYAGVAGTAWDVRLNLVWPSWYTTCCLVFHAACVLHIWATQPMLKGKQMPAILGRYALFAAVGTYVSAMGVFDAHLGCAVVAFATWSLGFALFRTMALGKWSSMWFHIILAVPQACMCEAVHHLPG